MRIAIVHSFYSGDSPSGENIVVEQQVAALRARGHDVRLIGRNTDDESSKPLYSLRAAITVASRRGPSPAADIEDFAPDVIHVHNLFPNFGQAWLSDQSRPVVATLHNYRPVCASGLLARDGVNCEQCLDRGSQRSIVNRCYRESRVKTIPLAIATRDRGRRDLVLTKARQLICLSERSLDTYQSAGVDKSKLSLIPNFAPDPGPLPPPDREAPWAFVGRLSAQKGIVQLLRAWPSHVPLRVVGAGPLEQEAKELALGKLVEFVGHASSTEVTQVLATSRGLVFASRSREVAPLTYGEALAAGRPVLAIGDHSVADDVRAHTTGIAVQEFSDLREGMRLFDASLETLSLNARERFASVFSEAAWARSIENTYASASGGFSG